MDAPVLVVWFVAGAYLLLGRYYHLPTLGAFITPVVLIVLVPALFGDPKHPEMMPERLRYPALTTHILAAGLGVALFGIAFAAAAMYLLQEREVKGKRFGALFGRLPSLDALDRMVQRLVRAGFVVFTVALIAGVIPVTWNHCAPSSTESHAISPGFACAIALPSRSYTTFDGR